MPSAMMAYANQNVRNAKFASSVNRLRRCNAVGWDLVLDKMGGRPEPFSMPVCPSKTMLDPVSRRPKMPVRQTHPIAWGLAVVTASVPLSVGNARSALTVLMKTSSVNARVSLISPIV